MKQLKDYIHHYIGCEVQHFAGIHGILKGVELPDTAIVEQMIDGRRAGRAIWNITSVKLKLRRMESMTEEQMAQLIVILLYNPEAEEEDQISLDDITGGFELFANDGGNLVDENAIIGAAFSVRCYEGQICINKWGGIDFYEEEGQTFGRTANLAEAIRYLLSERFDLFSLIEAGLAIDAATLTQK